MALKENLSLKPNSEANEALRARVRAGHGSPLTTTEVAQLTGLQSRGIHELAEAGELAHFRTPGGHLRFPVTTVSRYLSTTRVSPATLVVLGSDGVYRRLRRGIGGTSKLSRVMNAYELLLAVGRGMSGPYVIDTRHLGRMPVDAFFETLLGHAVGLQLLCIGAVPSRHADRVLLCTETTILRGLASAIEAGATGQSTS